MLEDAQGLYAFASLNKDGGVDLLMCHPRCAKQGAAMRLLTSLEEAARQQGLTRLFTQASLAARPAFAKCGFELSENRTALGMACFGMAKILD